MGGFWDRWLVPISLVGQDTRFSPWRPGFESRMGNFFFSLLGRGKKIAKKFETVVFGVKHVSMPEWLRGQTRNLMGFARVGSNPAANGPWLDGRAV